MLYLLPDTQNQITIITNNQRWRVIIAGRVRESFPEGVSVCHDADCRLALYVVGPGVNKRAKEF